MANDTRPHTKTQLRPGLFFSPGFYAGYWDNCILPNFAASVIRSSVKFTKHREMWIGSILAAAQTRASGVKHYVGLPDDEPSDVDVVRLVGTTLASGKTGTNVERLNVQITRCSLDDGETLLGQIKKKNKAAYKDIIVAVYVYGKRARSDYDTVFEALQQEDCVYPSEIIVVELAEMTKGGIIMPPGSYSVARIYPKKGQSIINVGDTEAFFRHPEVFEKTRRAATTKWEDLGSLTLMPPILNS